jgi:hypothetical protein
VSPEHHLLTIVVAPSGIVDALSEMPIKAWFYQSRESHPNAQGVKGQNSSLWLPGTPRPEQIFKCEVLQEARNMVGRPAKGRRRLAADVPRRYGFVGALV